MNAEALLFDFNGTLLDDEKENHEAWLEISRLYRGTPLTDEEYHFLNGKNDEETVLYLCPTLSQKEREAIAVVKERRYEELVYAHGLTLRDGVEAFLTSCPLPMALVSSAPKMNMDWYIPYFGLERFFSKEHILVDQHDLRPKPFPDYYLRATSRLGVDIQKSIIFEDSRSGLLAAKASGCGKIIAVASRSPSLGTQAIEGFTALPTDLLLL